MSKNDPVEHPAHYCQYEHEVIELTEKLDFCLGNAVKYILRAPYKGHEAEDLKKARWYLKRIVETDRCPVVKFDLGNKEDMELADSFKSPLMKDALWAFISMIPAYMEQTLAKLDTAILEAENRELKKQLKDAEDKAFLEAARLATTLLRRPSDLDTTKFWMAGYAI